MKISSKLLSLPPHLSTAWENVASLHVQERGGDMRPTLLVQLKDGVLVEIPGLNQTVLERVFEAHAQFLEENEKPQEPTQTKMGIPFKFGMDGMAGFGGMGGPLQHDPSQAEAPDLPAEILSKVAGVSQVLGVNGSEELPKPVPGCNCFYCQIAKAIGRGADANGEFEEDEEVSDEDLKFRTWDIDQFEDGAPFYNVTNPIDPSERYTVHLGEPIGCTCGDIDCEHIKAVLRS